MATSKCCVVPAANWLVRLLSAAAILLLCGAVPRVLGAAPGDSSSAGIAVEGLEPDIEFTADDAAASGVPNDGDEGAWIGIDLGTTYSCMTIYRDGEAHVIEMEDGTRTHPSCVVYDDESKRLFVGHEARKLSVESRNYFYDAKRLMGRTSSDENVHKYLSRWPFTIEWEPIKGNVDELTGKPRSRPYYCTFDKNGRKLSRRFSPEEISAAILRHLKAVAEDYLGGPVVGAVVTVPAHFGLPHREATTQAMALAGLKTLRVISEPTAATLAYGLDKKKDNTKILTYDLGGGTFDVSILDIQCGLFEVKATSGNMDLGGQDFDNAVITHIVQEFKKTHPSFNETAPETAVSMKTLKHETERAKIYISTATKYQIKIPNFYRGEALDFQLTRALFDHINKDAFQSTLENVRAALKDAHMSASDIDDVVLVGGSTRIPYIRAMLREFFKKPLHTEINPDEIVSYGAAVQSGIIKGMPGTSSIVVLDTVPISVGIETQGGVMSVLMKRGTSIPNTHESIYSTAADNQTSVTIRIFQGERPMTRDNHHVGEFELSGIPPAPRGVPQIHVKFTVDVNGNYEVSAADKSNPTSQTSLRIEKSAMQLSEAEMTRIVEEAKKFKDVDDEVLRVQQLRSQFESHIYSVRSTLADDKQRARLPPESATAAETEVASALEWLSSAGVSAKSQDIEQRKQKFEAVINPIMTELHKCAGAAGPGGFGDFQNAAAAAAAGAGGPGAGFPGAGFPGADGNVEEEGL